MNTKLELRKAIRKILTEDAERFEKMIKYSAGSGGPDVGSYEEDLKDFAKKHAQNDKEADDFIAAVKPALDDDVIPYAETIEAMFDDLTGYKEESSDEEDPAEEATVSEVESDLGDVESQLADFEEVLEDQIEQAYKAKDTEEFKEYKDNVELFSKYADFISRLFGKIIEFAKKKERQDVVDATHANIQVFQKWFVERVKTNSDLENELKKSEKDPDNPSQKMLKAMSKQFSGTINDFKKIVTSLKKDPLKKLNAKNILESVRKDQKMLTEIKRRRILKRRRR